MFQAFPLPERSQKSRLPRREARKEVQDMDPGWGCLPQACRAQGVSDFVILHLSSLGLTQLAGIWAFILGAELSKFLV